tara:strand:+ start:587 stop:775 length:189 start_codon:yes stop_codon:yes gene_type:complete
MSIKNLFKLKFLSKYTQIHKEQGYKGVINEGGWKIFIYLFLFFLVKGIIWIIIGYETVKLII